MVRFKIAKILSCMSILLLQPGLICAQAAETKGLGSEQSAGKRGSSRSAEASLSQERLRNAIAAIEKLAQAQVDNKVVPGLSISIVHDDKVVFAQGFGVREAGKAEKIDADTVFQLASVSKSVTSSVVAALVSEGKVSWDSRISELDPSFQLNDPWVTRELTIRDLLAHRSGLPEHAGDILEDIGYDRAQVLYRLRYQKPDSSFRSGYAYTNFGFTEGALAAAKACNMGWEDLAEAKLFKPLGMSSTSARFSDFMARANKTLNHVLVDGKWVHKSQRDADAQSPAGGVSSSANDLARWMKLEIADGKYDGHQLVSAKAVQETHHPQILTHFSPDTGLPDFYGLGFNVSYDQAGRLHLGHSGAFALGAATNVSMVPAERVGICVLTNAYPLGVAEGLATTFSDLFLYGKVSRDWLALFKQLFSDPATVGISNGYDYSTAPASVTAALKNDCYKGRYTNAYFGELEVIERDNGLALVVGPRKMTLPMKHYDRDIFTYDAATENLTGTSGLRFSIDADGKAANVMVEALNVRGQGLFTRVATE